MRSCMYSHYMNERIRRERNYRRNVKRERIFRDFRIARILHPIKGFNVLINCIVLGILAIVGIDFVIGKHISFIWLFILVIALVSFVKILKVK